MRIGFSSGRAFGEFTEKQRRAAARLRDAFFLDRTEVELAPLVEPL
jgi:hypothetical protein